MDIYLNTQTYKVYPLLDIEMRQLCIGGRGLCTRLLWDMVGPEVDPPSTEEEACQIAFYAKLINEPFIRSSQDERIM
jgi:hypothetical protein